MEISINENSIVSTPKKKRKQKGCYSKCNKLSSSDCKLPKCVYINGQTRKYCKLNTKKYNLDDKCNITRKKTPENIDDSRLQINQFINKYKHKKGKNIPKKEPSNVIGRFMRKTTKKRQSYFLKNICSDSGVCVAFGKETKKIFDFFIGFTDFTFLQSVKRTGESSANGFVNELKYTRLNYDAYTVLKSNQAPGNDNLVYEFIVGQFINKLCIQFPCFVETYGLYKYIDSNAWKHVHDTASIGKNVLNGLITLQPGTLDNWNTTVNWQDACQNSKLYSVLIQHIKDAKTLREMVTRPNFINHDLLFILYQVYMPLSTVGDKYTHYDLHDKNVLIYEPVPGKYIHYHYHLTNGKTIDFKSAYIAKIIDYGRSYFYDTITNNSKRIHSHICMLGNCRPRCGEAYGFGYLNEEIVFGTDGYIVSQKPNISHDLRLLNILKTDIHIKYYIKKLLDTTKYGIKVKPNMREFGTKENKVSGDAKNEINNVHDACKSIEKMIEFVQRSGLNNQKYPDNPLLKLGDLHIYADGTFLRYVHNV